MKRLLTLVLVLLTLSSACAEEIFVFGQSEQGRDLVCHRVGEGEKSALMVFAVHGFEDQYDQDGQLLVDIAGELLACFEQNPALLGDYSLYVVPCLNPDGLAEGYSPKHFGRANANEIDINRDFPVQWAKSERSRTRTGDAPFSTAEARALRSLVETIRPCCAVDVHGWINGVYGTPAFAACFQEAFGFAYREYQSGGMMAQWLEEETGTAVMVELPGNPYKDNFVPYCAQRLVQGMSAWMTAP